MEFPSWWAASAATYYPTGGWNIPNLCQPNPGARPPWSPCTYLGLLADQFVDGALVVVAHDRRRGDGAVLAEVTRGAVPAALLVHLAVLPLHLKSMDV